MLLFLAQSDIVYTSARQKHELRRRLRSGTGPVRLIVISCFIPGASSSDETSWCGKPARCASLLNVDKADSCALHMNAIKLVTERWCESPKSSYIKKPLQTQHTHRIPNN